MMPHNGFHAAPRTTTTTTTTMAPFALVDLLSPNNDVRKLAERGFDAQLGAHPDETILALLGALTSSENEAVKGLAAVLIRRVITRSHGDVLEILRPETRANLKATLLLCLDDSRAGITSQSLRKKICDTVGVIGAMSLQEDAEEEVEGEEEEEEAAAVAKLTLHLPRSLEGWPELLPYLFHSALSQNTYTKENALEIFSKIGRYVALNLEKSFDKIAHVFASCMSSSNPYTTRCAAIKAFSWMSENLDETEKLAPFKKPLLPLIFETMQALVMERNNALHVNPVNGQRLHQLITECFENLINVAYYHGKFFRGKSLAPMVGFLLNVAGSLQSNANERVGGREQDDEAAEEASSLKNLALEFLVTLVEHHPPMMKKLAPPRHAFLVGIIPILIKMMVDLNPRPDLVKWGNAYPDVSNPSDVAVGVEADDEESEGASGRPSDIVMALEYVDRLCTAAGPKATIPVVFSRVGELLGTSPPAANPLVAANDWRGPHAGLLLLAQSVEHMERTKENMDTVCGVASRFATSHDHPRVRYAAVTLIARLSYDCSPDIQTGYVNVLLPALMKCLDDAVPRVQCHACVAICNFTDSCGEEDTFPHFRPYFEPLVDKLFEKLTNGSRLLQEHTLRAISFVAESAGDLFKPLYGRIVSMLKQALMALMAQEAEAGHSREVVDYNASLKATTFDCISLIGVSVGPELFRPDASQLISWMPSLEELAQRESTTRRTYEVTWMRLAKCLGEEIEPYFERVMPFAMQAIAYQAPDTYTDANGDEVPYAELDEAARNDVQKARTAGIDDKLLAFRLVSTFADAAGLAFAPYVEGCLNVACHDILSSHTAHDDVRIEAAEMLGAVLKCLGRVGGRNDVIDNYARGTLDAILEALVEEESNDAKRTLLGAMRVLFQVARAISDRPRPDVPLPGVSPLAQQQLTRGDGPIPYETFEETVTVMLHLLRESIQRRAYIHARSRVGEEEEDGEEGGEQHEEDAEDALRRAQEDLESEETLRYSVSATIEEFVKCFPVQFVAVAGFVDGANNVGMNGDVPGLRRQVTGGEQDADVEVEEADGFASGSLADFVFDLAHPNRLLHDRQMAVFILDDLAEHAPLEALLICAGRIGEVLIQAASTRQVPEHSTETTSQLAALLQASYYGLGMLGTRCASNVPAWNALAERAVHNIFMGLRTMPPTLANDAEFFPAFDNGVSAMMKIATNSRLSAYAEVALEWLNRLPLRADMQEARYNSALLLQGIQSSMPPPQSGTGSLLGLFPPEDPRSRHVFTRCALVLIAVIGTEMLQESLVDGALDALLGLKAACGEEEFTKIVSTVPREDLARLQGIRARKAGR